MPRPSQDLGINLDVDRGLGLDPELGLGLGQA